MTIVSMNPLTGKREYTCPQCTKVYSYQTTLLRHLKFECGKFPRFQCPHCPYRCHRKENIKSHVIGKHEKGKKIQCPICPKTFVHKFRMQEHIRLFHNVNPTMLNPVMPPQQPQHSLSLKGTFSQLQSEHSVVVVNPFSPTSSETSHYFECNQDDPDYCPYTSTPKKGSGRKPRNRTYITESKITPQVISVKDMNDPKNHMDVNCPENGIEAVDVKEECTIYFNDSVDNTNDNVDPLTPSAVSGDDVLKVIF